MEVGRFTNTVTSLEGERKVTGDSEQLKWRILNDLREMKRNTDGGLVRPGSK